MCFGCSRVLLRVLVCTCFVIGDSSIVACCLLFVVCCSLFGSVLFVVC